MTSPIEDNAVEVITEIDYDNISNTRVLADQYKSVKIIRLKPSNFGRWTRVQDIGHHYKSEQVHRPKTQRIGVLFQNVSEYNSDIFLPIDSIPKLLEEDELERGPEGNSPHCLFCTGGSSHESVEWPIDPTYSIHQSCFDDFKIFINDLFELYNDLTLSHMI